MSHSHDTASESPRSKFQRTLDDAVKTYQERTKHSLLDHPLASQLQDSSSAEGILSILSDRFPNVDQSQRFERLLKPTIKTLITISQVAGSGSLSFSPSKAIFTGIGILLSAASEGNHQDNFVAIFERIKMFFGRLEIYAEVQQTEEMTNKIIQIMVEVIDILGIATEEINQGRIKKFGKKLIGRTDMEDAMERFDKLTREEAWISIVKVMRAVHAIDETVAMATNIEGYWEHVS